MAVIRDNQHIKKWDYLIVFLLLAVSGNPLIVNLTEYIFIIVAVFFVLLSSSNHTPLFTKQMQLVGGVLLALYALQFVIVREVSLPADVNHFAKVYCGFLAATLVGYRFRYAYYKVMVFLCAIALIGFSVNLIIGQFPGINYDRYVSLVLYNYIPKSFSSAYDGGIRNSGMFWEPGAFQGYIMLALLFYMNEFKTFYRSHKVGVWILIAALLTTRSTTGYLVFATFLFLVFSGDLRKSPVTAILLIALVGAAFWAFNHFDFLGDKMAVEYEEARDLGSGDVTWSRMGSALIAWENTMRHPFTGNGFLMSSLYGNLAEYMEGMGNGFFGTMNQLGIPFMLFYLFLLFKNNPMQGNVSKWLFVLLIVLLLNGEFFLNYPLYWALLFIKYPSNEKISSSPHRA